MVYFYLFSLFASVTIFLLMIIHILRQKRSLLSTVFSVQVACVLIWTVGSIFEVVSQHESSMLLFRNIQQIGVFYIPLSTWVFAIVYTRRDRLKPTLYFFTLIQTVAIVLIFTDSHHHLMRSATQMAVHPLFGHQILVQSTLIGMVFVTMNYVLVFFSILLLLDFALKVSRSLRRQVLGIAASQALTVAFAWFKMTFLEHRGIYVPMAVIYLPSSLILFYTLFKHHFLKLSPLARDTVFDVIREGILVVDSAGLVVDFNPYFLELVQRCFDIEPIHVGMNIREILSAKWSVARANPDGPVSYEIKVRDDQYLGVSTFPLKDGERIMGGVWLVKEITYSKNYERLLMDKGYRDSMTKLLNREGFKHFASPLWTEIAHGGGSAAFLMMDLDFFKKINDTYGHSVGDRVIQRFAEILLLSSRGADVAARLGGEEFVLVLSGMDKVSAFAVAERLRKAVEADGIQLPDGLLTFTVSIGISGSQDGESLETCLDLADRALYQAKKQSRNCTMVWGEPANARN